MNARRKMKGWTWAGEISTIIFLMNYFKTLLPLPLSREEGRMKGVLKQLFMDPFLFLTAVALAARKIPP